MAIKAVGPCFGARLLVVSLPFDRRESYALYNTSAVPGDYSWQSVRRISPEMRVTVDTDRRLGITAYMITAARIAERVTLAISFTM
jgi:hypothetical protein